MIAMQCRWQLTREVSQLLKRRSTITQTKPTAAKFLIFDLIVSNNRLSLEVSKTKISTLSDLSVTMPTSTSYTTLGYWSKNKFLRVSLAFCIFLRARLSVWVRRCLNRCKNVIPTKLDDSVTSKTVVTSW
jgi:hypothetical protein